MRVTFVYSNICVWCLPRSDDVFAQYPVSGKQRRKYHLHSSNCVTNSLSFEPRHDKTNKVSVRPAKTQISLGIRRVWSESSLCAQWVAKDPNFLHVDSEDSDQTGRIPKLIWVVAGRTAILLVLSCRCSFTSSLTSQCCFLVLIFKLF